MSIISTQMISALNNYSSIAPIMTKDIIENAGRTTMAYCNSGKETRKYEATEKFIDANMSSVFWFGSIPFVNKIFNMTAFKSTKLNPDVSLAYLKKDETTQTIDNVLNKIAKNELPEKILSKKGKVIDAKQALETVKNNQKTFKNLQIAKMMAGIGVAIFLSAVVLPKSIIALTQFVVNKNEKNKKNNVIEKPKTMVAFGSESKAFSSFYDFIGKKDSSVKKIGYFPLENVPFKSLAGKLFDKAVKFQTSALDGMAVMDIGISGGRVYYADKRQREALNGKPSKNRYAAALEKTIREAGAFYLIYFGGNQIKNGIDKLTKNDLDPIILEDKGFVQELKSGVFAKNPIKNMSDKEALDFIDSNINNAKQPFIKYAKKLNWIETAKTPSGKTLRNPLKYVKVKELSENFDKIVKTTGEFLAQGGDNLEKFVAKKAKIKRLGIYGNLAGSMFAVCYVLPKIVYGFRKLYTGSNEEPGIKEVINNSKKAA